MRTRLLALCLAALGVPAAAAGQASLTLEALPVIGRVDGPGPDVFGRIAGVEMDSVGNVYVLDRLARAVQVFDANGDFVRTIGREGEGPGELREPVALGWGPEGNLWVVDPANGRYSVFDREGEFLTSHVRVTSTFPGPFPITFTSDGRLFDVGSEMSPEGPNPIPIEVDIRGPAVRQVREVELPDAGPWGPCCAVERPDGRLILIEVPFGPTSIWRIGPRGELWWASTGGYEVHRRVGGVETVFSGDAEPVPVTDAERAAALDNDENLTPGMIPDRKPVIRGILFGEDGELGVLLRSAGPLGERRLDAFGDEGAFIASLAVNLAAEPQPQVRHGILFGVARDELGVERVVRYRIGS